MAPATLLVLRQKRQEGGLSCRGQIRRDDLQYLLPDVDVYFCESLCGVTLAKDILSSITRLRQLATHLFFSAYCLFNVT